MFNTPTDCYNYIIENDLEMPVLGAMMNHVGGYSIAEIADGRFHNRDGAVSFSSPHLFYPEWRDLRKGGVIENGKWRMENERGDLVFSIVWFIGAYGLQGRAMRALCWRYAHALP